MTLIHEEYGCKVGWLTYDNEAEARERAAKARLDAEDKAARGYDFGYCVPGEVRKVEDGWVVTIP